MTKAELFERIVDSFIDMSGEDPHDYLYLDDISLEEATMYLAEQRATERDCDYLPEECLPAEVTPELYMEAENCFIRHMKFEARVSNLAEYITDNCMVCEYVNYYLPAHEDAVDLIAVDFLCEHFPFDIGDRTPDPLFLIELGKRSRNFNSAEEFCLYDKEKDQLYSTNNPFMDELIDAEAFARFVLLDADTLDCFINYTMSDEDIRTVFGCTKEELINA